ncbi:MAG TPA: hypothetical protein DCG33_05695 [Prevotellaceae bacterium]|nr:hypothetical protein [Prevotellaceae bacterium]
MTEMDNPLSKINIGTLISLPVTDLGHAIMTIERHHRFMAVYHEKMKSTRNRDASIILIGK